MGAIRTKPDSQSYTFEGFGTERFPNFMLRGAGDLDNWHLKTYEQRHEGYEALRKALKLDPAAVTAEVKASGLRGRGGGGLSHGIEVDLHAQGFGRAQAYALPGVQRR